MHTKLLRTLALGSFLLLGAGLTAQAHVMVVSPNGGETLLSCGYSKVQFIVLMDHGVGPIDIEYSTDYGNTFKLITTIQWPGGTGPGSVMWLVPDEFTTEGVIQVTYTNFMGIQVDLSDAAFTIAAPTKIRGIGGQIGGTLAYDHFDPCHPLQTGVTWTSLTGAATPLPLPGGQTIQLNVDAFTFVYLANPFLSITTLDGFGMATTGGLPIPNNQALVGLQIYAAMATYKIGEGFVAASPTITVALS